MDKPKHGGKRPGSGQPKKEETVTISVRVPKLLRNDLMTKYRGKLNQMIAEYLRSL